MTASAAPAATSRSTERARGDVAVIIPTKDRPQYLEEAIASAIEQSILPKEIIVVDDGSQVPVDSEALRVRHGPAVSVLRNETSTGLAFSRNRGVEACCSTYFIHLDDDDRLAPDAIERCLSVYADFPATELVMFAVEGFGPNADHFNRVQPDGMQRVIDLAQGRQIRPGIVAFDQRLFPVLLERVPSAFQRVMTTRETWRKVSELRWRAYGLDLPETEQEAAKRRIAGPLRDSEWAWYAAAFCKTTCLITDSLYFARCAGQGYSSVPANRQAHMLQGISMLNQLTVAAGNLEELAKWRIRVRTALAIASFDAAYFYQQAEDRPRAWHFLKSSMAARLRIAQFRLLLRLILFPRTP